MTETAGGNGRRRILVLGCAPLPFEITNRSYGPGTRTWQCVQPLLEDGHEVHLVAMRIPETFPEDTPSEVVQTRDRFTYANVDGGVYFDGEYVRRAAREFRPDAVVFAHAPASYESSILAPEAPTWIDLCGHVMAEAQAKAAVYRDNQYLDYFFRKIRGALINGDRFSTVSDAQRFALVGELGLLGRLNWQTNHTELIHTIPCGAEEEEYTHDRTVLRGIDVEEDDFVVLWSGGFNTWSDVDALFGGLVHAMERNPSIRFVATGGQIDGHDEKTFPRFVDMVETSEFRDRFVLKGWLPRDLVHNYYFEADVGINCEKDIYEVRMGSKHRILDWSRAGLPVVSTRVTELSNAVERHEVGFVCRAEDPVALGRAILDAAERRSELPEMGAACRKVMRRLYGFAESTTALRAWARNPEYAPDRDRRPTCVDRILRVRKDLEAAPKPELLPVPTEAPTVPENEGRVEWALRVAHRSVQQGGPVLAARRVVRRMLGRGTSYPVLPALTGPDGGEPLVSVVVLSLNGEDYISGCLETLSENDYPNFEIIVVNNGSTDSTPKIVAEGFPHVRLINLPENKGFAGGMNEGLKAARGGILVPLNDDTICTPTLISDLVEPVTGETSIGIVGCKILYPDRKTIQHAGAMIGPMGSTLHFGYQEVDEGQHDEPRDCDYVTGCVMAVRRELFEQIGLFDDRFFPTYYEETEFAVRARKSGYRVLYNPKAVLYHLESMTEIAGSQQFLFRYHRSRWRFVLKNFSTRQVLRALKHEIRYIRGVDWETEGKQLSKAHLYILPRLPMIAFDRHFRRLPIGKPHRHPNEASTLSEADFQ